jgi:hypothetical protein
VSPSMVESGDPIVPLPPVTPTVDLLGSLT